MDVVRSILPTITAEYWFFTAYIVLLLLSPYINIFIRSSTQKDLSICLSIMLMLWGVIPTFTSFEMFGSEIPQFLMFYLLGAYFRVFPGNALSKPICRRWLIGGSAVLLFTSSATIRIFNDYVWSFSAPEIFFYNRNSILIIGLAVGMVSSAIYHKAWSNRIVNTISSCTFGVYLFHDNPLIRKVIWPVWLNNDAFYDSQTFILRILLSVIVVYLGCTAIELLRQKAFAKPMEFLIGKALNVCCRMFKAFAAVLRNMGRHSKN